LSIEKKIISATSITPEVILYPEGIIRMKGQLIPENASVFFNDVTEWVNKYLENPADTTCIDIILDYINSTGNRYLLDMIRRITVTHLKSNSDKFIINWHYEEEDEIILDHGKIYSSLLEVPINYIVRT